MHCSTHSIVKFAGLLLRCSLKKAYWSRPWFRRWFTRPLLCSHWPSTKFGPKLIPHRDVPPPLKVLPPWCVTPAWKGPPHRVVRMAAAKYEALWRNLLLDLLFVTLAMKAEVSMTALICLSQPLLSSPDRNAFIDGFFSSHTEKKNKK